MTAHLSPAPPIEPDEAPDPRPGREGRTRITRIGGYEIHSVEFGSGAEDLVLVHGLSGSSRWWERNIPGLAERYRVFIPDLIGFGRSPRPRGRLPGIGELADVLGEWIRRVGPPEAHVIGHSMGGQLAIHLAATHPEQVKSLVLVDAAGIPRPVTPRTVVRFAREIAPVWRWGDLSFVPVIFSDAWTAGPRTLLQAIGHILNDDVRPLLPRIQAPTLVLWGEKDNWVPLAHGEEMYEKIPGARFEILRRAAHNPMVDRPFAFNRVVLDFLSGRE
jgi:pimeloyl-ACP methyl ester carboxylesterase